MARPSKSSYGRNLLQKWKRFSPEPQLLLRPKLVYLCNGVLETMYITASSLSGLLKMTEYYW